MPAARARAPSCTTCRNVRLRLACLPLGIPGGAAAADCARGTLVGDVTHIRDGDTIEVGGLPVRLQGLAAPEGNESGGTEATEAMRQMVLGREVRCELDGEHTHDRWVRICYLDGEDISEVIVHRIGRRAVLVRSAEVSVLDVPAQCLPVRLPAEIIPHEDNSSV